MSPVQVMEKKATSPNVGVPTDALVYCPICTHSVHGKVRFVRNAAARKTAVTVSGQRCSRCASPLDAAVVLRIEEAA